MQLLPCVLLSDFGTSMLADTLTTAQRRRWSTSEVANWNIDLTRAQSQWDRKSLRIATDATSGNDANPLADRAIYGSTDQVDKTDIMNAFGADVNDLTWCTNLSAWMYHTDDTPATTDVDALQMVVTNNGGQDVVCRWTTALDVPDRWRWVSSTPTWGTFAANGDNIEQFIFQGGKPAGEFTAASYFYLNNYVAYRSTLSTVSDDYTATNGINLWSSSYIPTGWNSWRVTGNIVGDYPLELAQQLHEMATLGISTLQPLRRPSPKFQALQDCDNIKTYLMYQEEPLGGRLLTKNAGNTVTSAVPVVITNVSTEWVAPSKEILSFSFDALRFSGV